MPKRLPIQTKKRSMRDILCIRRNDEVNHAVIIIRSTFIRKMGDANGEKNRAPRCTAHA